MLVLNRKTSVTSTLPLVNNFTMPVVLPLDLTVRPSDVLTQNPLVYDTPLCKISTDLTVFLAETTMALDEDNAVFASRLLDMGNFGLWCSKPNAKG